MKFFFYFFLTVLVLAIALIQPINVDDFNKQDYFHNTSQRISAIETATNETNQIKVGWHRINFTPPKATELAGYSGRGVYSEIKDSIYANCLFVESAKGNYVILNFDLILIHHTFSEAIEKELLNDSSLNLKGIYYTCSHTHSSYGGWAKGLLSKFVLGGYDQETIDFMLQQTTTMVQQAAQHTSQVKMAFSKIKMKDWLINRVDPKAAVDDYLRLIVFENSKQERSALLSFSGHPTFMTLHDHFLSGDFAGMTSTNLIDSLHLQSLLYVSGAIGSTSVNEDQGYEHAIDYAKKLSDTIIPAYNKLTFDPINYFNYNQVNIDLPAPQFKLNNSYALRPFWFQFIFGKPQAKVACLELNQLKLTGVSGEISGETFSQVLEKTSLKDSTTYIPTSFNGDYIGYLTKGAHYYSRESAETRDMNLYGPTNTDYFVEIISHFLNHIHPSSKPGH